MFFVLGVVVWVVGWWEGQGGVGFVIAVVLWGIGLRELLTDPTLKQQPASPQRALSAAESVAAVPNPYDIPALMAAGDWATARLMLQKMAYTMPRESEETRELFKGLMKKFAVEDPLYARALAAVRPLVAQEPGIKQTELYRSMPTSNVEEARYVLYFAHELGDLVRVKKGNSYQVFPAGYEPPALIEAPKRVRKPRQPKSGDSA